MQMDDFSTLSSYGPGNKSYVDCTNNNIISEAGLSRLVSQFSKTENDFAIISAYRFADEAGNIIPKSEKIKANRKLRTKLNSMRMGVYNLVGHWKECQAHDKNGNKVAYDQCPKNKLVDVVERSYFVPKNGDISSEEFENLIQELIKKATKSAPDRFNQDSAILRQKGKMYFVYPSGPKDFLGTKMSLNKISRAYSQHIGKINVPFVFEGVEIPNSISGMIMMENFGILYPVELNEKKSLNHSMNFKEYLSLHGGDVVIDEGVLDFFKKVKKKFSDRAMNLFLKMLNSQKLDNLNSTKIAKLAKKIGLHLNAEELSHIADHAKEFMIHFA